jgi:hypothetical protein
MSPTSADGRSGLVESIRNLLREQLGFFNSYFRVWMLCEKLTNGRADDRIHLVRINHVRHSKMGFIGRAPRSTGTAKA